MAIELDYMENYTSDVLAQAAYPTNGHHAITFNGTAQLDTAAYKWGTASLLLDGDSDYLSLPDSEDWDIGTNFTIDFFVRLAVHSGTEVFVYHGAAGDDWIFRHKHGFGLRFMIFQAAGLIVDVGPAGEITDSNWHHVALIKVANEYGIYLDGTQVAYKSDADLAAQTGDLLIGCHSNLDSWVNGNIDELRIVHANPFNANPADAFGNGEAPDTITIPTAAHQTDTNTVLLLHFDGADEATATPDWSRCESRSESTIKQQGSYSLEGFAKATDALNDTLTRTVGPTIDLSGEEGNEIKFDIRSSRTGSNIKIGIHDAGGVTTEHTANVAQANVWQTETWDMSGVADGDKDAIDSIIVTIVNADADNAFYLDNMFSWPTGGEWVLELTEILALLESLPGLDRAMTAFEEQLAMLESLTELDRGLTLTELLALKEEETVDINSLLTESLGLLESLPTLTRALTVTESLALLESLPTLTRALTVTESLALLESLPTLEHALTLLDENLAMLESERVAIASVLTENLALKEDLTQLGRTLTLEESLALLEEIHAASLLCEIDKLGNIKLSGLVGSGNVYAYVDSDGKVHRGAAYP